MPPPTAGSDDVFLIAIAMIAGVVVLIMGAATFLVLRSDKQKERSARPGDETVSVPPVEIVAPSPSTERPEIALPSTPPVDIVNASPPEAGPQIGLHSGQRAIRSLGGIFLTTALMFAVPLAMLYFIFFHVTQPVARLLLLATLPIGIAVAGTVGVRLTHLEWRLMLVSVLLFLVGSVVLLTILSYSNNPFLLALITVGSVSVPWMNREGKEVNFSLQAGNWFVCFILASLFAFFGFLRLRGILGAPLPIPAYLYWSAISMAFLGPACIAVAWLRLSGMKWLPALLMIPALPVGVFIILVLTAEAG